MANVHATNSADKASTTFHKDVSIRVEHADIGAASISPSGRDVVLASKTGLLILDLDRPYSPPRHIFYRTDWAVADVQWSPFACRAGRIATTANQKALILNLDLSTSPNKAPVEFTLHAHSRAITDINFSAHHPDLLATCAVDSFVLTWDLRTPKRPTELIAWRCRPVTSVADFEAGATQVKWNRRNEHVLASSHDKYLRVWDTRMSAMPLTTVTAHNTKIYGIDWHRSDPHKILTCSLDKTIKQWERVGLDNALDTIDMDQAARVIPGHHPVWRARHTPFPNGILSMPQRGSSALNLYTQTGPHNPVHTFHAHEDGARVQEFLWRSRGSFDDGIDNREFQLVTWGTDRYLHLYTVTPQLLHDSVGFCRGGQVTEPPSTTRRGADYESYRDYPRKGVANPPPGPSTVNSAQPGNLSSLLRSRLIDLGQGMYATYDPQRERMTAGTIRHGAFDRVVSNLSWVQGVRFHDGEGNGDRGDGTLPPGHDTVPDDLAAEVSQVGSTYTRVDFETVDLTDRFIIISFQGPWGEVETSVDRQGERKLAFLRLTVRFPPKYPHVTVQEGHEDNPDAVRSTNPLEIEFHRTTAAIDEATLASLKGDMDRIAQHRAASGLDALDAIVCYALGERNLEDSLMIPGDATHDQGTQGPDNMPDLMGEESSSSDDESMGIDNNDLLKSSLTSANIPLPIQCTTRFSASGPLVLARPPSKKDTARASQHPSAVRLPRLPAQALSRNEIFESFGRLNIPHGYDSESPTSSTASWEWASSPSSSSQSDDAAGMPQARFQPPIAWQTPALRFNSRTSHPSSIGATKASKAKSVVTILASSAEEWVPSKRGLAERYWIFGNGPQVCMHNAHVARQSGFEDLANVWELCSLILNNEVPLDILPQHYRREQVLVLARRALVRIKRKDSGLDLQFDEAETVTNPKLKGRIKWGHHSIVSWLIPALFDHFERLADIQMLAMLACIFSEPATREGVTSAMAKTTQSHLPMSMEAPAFSLDYFSSADAAWSLFRPTVSVPSTPAHSRFAAPANEFGWHRITKGLDTYGSHGSSNGPWGSDTVPSEPVTPYSTGNTPPNLSRAPTGRSTASATPFSTSPEQSSHVLKKASTANFASAFATLSRPFANAISSSPPVKSRNEADISTSAPTSGVTWGTTTFYNGGDAEREITTPRAKNGKRASFGHADQLNVIDYYPDSDSDYDDSLPPFDAVSEYAAPLTPGSGDEHSNIRVTLKNQNQFDDEACVSAPLLDMSKEWLYRAWRDQYAEMLGSWGLVSQRAEILKFDGLTSYFPLNGSRATSKAGSLQLGLRQDGADTPLPLSRTSSTLVPPPLTPQYKRSPLASPRNFSFNPEATEFQPGGASFDPELLAAPPDVFISSEQYLRLSIPAPQVEDTGIREGAIFETHESKSLRPRPALTRALSKHSSIAGKKEKKEIEPIYSCSICWIRVSGRFYLCPSCGHVAHFDCMESGSGDEVYFLGHVLEEGECVVGCGCGCGLDDEDPDDLRARRTPREGKDIDDYFRRWEERNAWAEAAHDEGTGAGETHAVAYEGGYGHGLGTSYSPKDEKKSRLKQIRKGIRRTASAK